MPDIKLDFSKITYSGALEIIAPIVPGGILAVGTLTLNPTFSARILSNPYLGYRSRVLLAMFVSYLAGLLLYLIVTHTSYFVGYVIGALWGKNLFPNQPTPWRNLIWRRAAKQFLGPGLAPDTEDLYFADMHQKQTNEASAIQDPGDRARQLKFVNDFFMPKQVAENDWYWWYQVLSSVFAKPDAWAPPALYYLGMLNAASFATVFLMVANHRHNWFTWMLCLVGLFFGNVGAWFAGYGSDPYGVAQTAMILRILLRPGEAEVSDEGKEG